MAENLKSRVAVEVSVRDKASRGLKRVQTSLRNLARSVERTSKSTRVYNRNMQKATMQTTRFRIETSGLRRAIGAVRNQILLVVFALGSVFVAMKKSIQASIELEAALIGLGAVAEKTGDSKFKAMSAALELTTTGLLTVTEASAGLKNLLSTGHFTLEQSIKLMNALTNAAAFNRQGTLALGEAVVGATQGVKNQMSIMVDNAGITKNLSIMQKEYAASLGTTIGKLTEAQKMQAVYVGILKEAGVFAGNAALLTDTLSGAQSRFNVNMFETSAALGDVLRGGYKVMLEMLSDVIKKLKEYLVANKDVLKLKITVYFERIIKFLKDLGAAIKLVIKFFKLLDKITLGIPKAIYIYGLAIMFLSKMFLHLIIKIMAFARVLGSGTIAMGTWNKSIALNIQMTRLMIATNGAATITQVRYAQALALSNKAAFTGTLIMSGYLMKVTGLLARIPILGGLFKMMYVSLLKFNNALIAGRGLMAAFMASAGVWIAIAAAIAALAFIAFRYFRRKSEAIQKSIKQEIELARKIKDGAQEIRDRNAEVVSLAREHSRLNDMVERTAEQEERLAEIGDRLNEIIPSLSDNFDNLSLAAERAEESLDRMNRTMLRSELSINISKAQLAQEQLGEAIKGVTSHLDKLLVKANEVSPKYDNLTGAIIAAGNSTSEFVKKLKSAGIEFEITSENAAVMVEKLEKLKEPLVDRQSIIIMKDLVDRTEDEKKELIKLNAELERFKNLISLAKLVRDFSDDLKSAKDRIVDTKEALFNFGKVAEDSVKKAKERVAELLEKFEATSQIRLVFGVAGEPTRAVPVALNKANEEIDRIAKEYEGRITFKIRPEIIDVNPAQLQALMKSAQSELKKIEPVNITAIKEEFTKLLFATGKGEQVITDNLEAIRSKLISIKRTYEQRLDIVKALRDLKAEGTIKKEILEMADALEKAAGIARKNDLAKMIEQFSKKGKDALEVMERLITRMTRFLREGAKASDQLGRSFIDNLIGLDFSGMNDKIRKANDTYNQLVKDILASEMHWIIAFNLIDDLTKAFRALEAAAKRTESERIAQQWLGFIDQITGGFDRIGQYVVDRRLGVNQELEKRLNEVMQMHRDEVITTAEKERQITAIERASQEERKQMQKEFFTSMLANLANMLGKHLTQIATAALIEVQIEKQKQAVIAAIRAGGALGALAGVGLIAAGIGLQFFAGSLMRRTELRGEGLGFGALESPNKLSGAEGRDRLSGTVNARELSIVIAPSITIEGETIIVGQVGIEELKQTLGDMSVSSVKQAIEDGVIDLSRLPN